MLDTTANQQQSWDESSFLMLHSFPGLVVCLCRQRETNSYDIMTTDEKIIVIRSVILDVLELLPRKDKRPPRGVTAPVNRAVRGHPATGNSAVLWEGAEQETPRSTSQDVCSPRGFPLPTKNIRSHLHQQRQRDGEAQEQRGKKSSP